QPASDERAPAFTRPLNVVYADAQVTIRENPTALPRAWLVHRAKQVAPGTAAGVLASGAVDARQVVLLETAPPPDLGEPPDGADETVRIEAYAADRLSVRAASSMASVLILSEVYYPAWQAYVDGQPTPVLVADGALRAVALPAGEHVVEMRFESLALRVGLALSLMSALLLAGLVTGVALEQGTNRSVGHRGGARPRSP
ncbi:MAG TPA: YfhO family protein, partial [Chloroflexota bacterium]|nr:YfhO family protein [Chloroflexota bacterium]